MKYLACEGIDFYWEDRDVEEFRRLWEEGYEVSVIAKFLRRTAFETTALAIDQLQRRKIRSRTNGIDVGRVKRERSKRHAKTN